MKSFFLAIFSFAVAWLVLPDYEYFPTQNSAYHAAFARDYLSPQIGEVLETSSIPGNYIDQHFVFNFLLTPFIYAFVEQPWVGIKVFQSLVYGFLLFVLLSLSWRRGGAWWTIFVFALWILHLDYLMRFNFLRVDVLSLLLLIVTCWAFFRKWSVASGRYLWLVSFVLAVSVSWVNLVLLALPLFQVHQSLRKQLQQFGIGVALFVLLQIFVNGLEGVFLFFDLFKQNFLTANGISEWQGPREPLKTLGFSFLVLMVMLPQVRKKQADGIASGFNAYLFSLSCLFFVLTYFYQRFQAPLLVTALFLLGLGGFEYVRSFSFRNLALKVLTVVLLVGASAKIYNQQQNPSFRLWGEVTDIRDMHAWSENHRWFPKKVVNLLWESWGEMLWYFPQTKSEPGFTLSIYDQTARAAVQCLSKFRRTDFKIPIEEFARCRNIISQKFGSSYLFFPRRWDTRALREKAQYFDFIFYGPQSVMIRFKSDSEVMGSLRSQPVKTVTKGLLPPSFFMDQGLLRSRDENGNFLKLNQREFLRSAYSAWIFCRYKIMNSALCSRSLKAHLQHLLIEKSYATKAFVGLLAHELGEQSEFRQKLKSYFLDDIDPSGAFKGVRYGTSEEYFYPGEILIFLMTEMNELEKDKIAAAVRHYGQTYVLKRDPFMIRWLSEVLILYRDKYQDQQFDTLFPLIERQVQHLLPQYCKALNRGAQTLFYPGLWLEGLALTSDDLFSNTLKLGLFRCHLSSLKEISFAKNRYAFAPLDSRGELVSVDNHAHGLAAWYRYLENK